MAHQDTINLLLAVGAIIQKHRASRIDDNLNNARQFNPLNYIDPRENIISNILRDLFDPSGPHGQGATFLKLFVRPLGYLQDIDRTVVIREHLTSTLSNQWRRIDLLIDFGDFGIGIENKPWAAEQINQVEDYVEHLKIKYGSEFIMVYLSGEGKEPTSILSGEREQLTSSGNFRTLHYYPDLFNWIVECHKECNANRVSWFLEMFGEYLRKEFDKEFKGSIMTSHEEQQEILDRVLASQESLEANFRLYQAFDPIRDFIVQRFVEAVQEETLKQLKTNNISWTSTNASSQPYRHLSFYKPQWRDKCSVCLEASDTLKKVWIGVKRANNARTVSGLKDDLDASVQKGGTPEGLWDWWIYIDSSIGSWNDPNILMTLYNDLNNRELVTRVAGKIAQVAVEAGNFLERTTAPEKSS